MPIAEDTPQDRNNYDNSTAEIINEPAATESMLIDQAAHGDEGAFAALVERHKDKVFNLTLRYLGDREEALDLTQDPPRLRSLLRIGGVHLEGVAGAHPAAALPQGLSAQQQVQLLPGVHHGR